MAAAGLAAAGLTAAPLTAAELTAAELTAAGLAATELAWAAGRRSWDFLTRRRRPQSSAWRTLLLCAAVLSAF